MKLDPEHQGAPAPDLVPADWSELQMQLRRRQSSGLHASCQLSTGMRPELGLAAIALAEASRGGKGPKPSSPRSSSAR